MTAAAALVTAVLVCFLAGCAHRAPLREHEPHWLPMCDRACAPFRATRAVETRKGVRCACDHLDFEAKPDDDDGLVRYLPTRTLP